MENNRAALAKAYADMVQFVTTESEFAAILERNALQDYETCDATADFLDHEQTLLDAFQKVMGREAELSDENDLGLLCDAHNQAIDHYLTKKA